MVSFCSWQVPMLMFGNFHFGRFWILLHIWPDFDSPHLKTPKMNNLPMLLCFYLMIIHRNLNRTLEQKVSREKELTKPDQYYISEISQLSVNIFSKLLVNFRQDSVFRRDPMNFFMDLHDRFSTIFFEDFWGNIQRFLVNSHNSFNFFPWPLKIEKRIYGGLFDYSSPHVLWYMFIYKTSGPAKLRLAIK